MKKYQRIFAINLFSSVFLSILIFFAVFSAVRSLSAEVFIGDSGSEYSLGSSGLLCLRFRTETNTQIRLFQFDSTKMTPLFTNAIESGIEPPICFSNSVIAVSSDSVVRKYNLNGRLVFKTVPTGIKGACGWARKLDRTHIFMTETVANKQNVEFRLHIVDISGGMPIIKKSYDIIEPYQVAYNWHEIIVSSETNNVRVEIPEGL